MSDLDDQLTGLRENLRDSVEPPGLRDVADRATRRRVRNRMMIAAAVAVVAVSVAVPLLRGPLGPDDYVPPATNLPKYLPTTPFISTLDFADARHGFAIRQTCPEGHTDSCRGELLATSDGRTWREVRVPQMGSWKLNVNLIVLGPSEIVVDHPKPGRNGSWTRLHSTDGGRTWREVDVTPSALSSIDHIPAGAQLIPWCASYLGTTDQCAEAGLGVVVPGTAVTARLTVLPPLKKANQAMRANGRWWVAGRDPQTDRWTAASSTDGRTWTAGDLLTDDDTIGGWAFATTGSTSYAAAVGLQDAGLRGLYRSTDGGQSWQLIERAAGAKPTTILGRMVATPDGLLITSSREGELIDTSNPETYRSSDGGRTFERVSARFPGYLDRDTTAGYLAFDSDRQRSAFSADGVKWRELSLPK